MGLAKDLEQRLFEIGNVVYFLGIGNVLYGVDADLEKVGMLLDGRSYVLDVTASEVAAMDRATYAVAPDALADADRRTAGFGGALERR